MVTLGYNGLRKLVEFIMVRCVLYEIGWRVSEWRRCGRVCGGHCQDHRQGVCL